MIGLAGGPGGDGEILEAPAKPFLDGCPHALGAVIVDQELQAGLGAREAVLQILAPDVEDGPGGWESVLGLDEDTEVARDARRRGEPAAHADAEAKPLTFRPGLAGADEDDAVDLRGVALVGASRDGDLVLARQVEVFAVS